MAMMYDGDGHGGGWVLGMVLMMVLFWGSIVALIWVGLRSLVHHPSGPAGPSEPSRPDAREVLALRLARGEIEPEEYQRRLAVLDADR